MARPTFIELPAKDLSAAKSFYAQVFGWSLAEFGSTYACTTTGDVDVGLQGDGAEATAGPLVVIQVEDLEETLSTITTAGATITRPIFSFPGGRRFHFLDPNGNELAAYQPG